MHVSFAYRPYTIRLGLVATLNLSCAFYVANVIRGCKAGWPRLLLAIPVIVVNCYVPLLFLDETEVISKALILLCSFWISNFKLLALCLDRGSLTRPWTFAQFAALYSVPIMPRDQMPGDNEGTKKKNRGSSYESGGKTAELALRFIAKGLVLGAVTYTLTTQGDNLSTLSIHILYAISLYTFLGCAYDGPASLATSMIGLEIAPHFDKPFFSESFSAMWGRRWNTSVGHTLRTLIYNPIVEGQLIKTPSQKGPPRTLFRRWIGACACFLVSGIMHELIYWYAENRHTVGWKWLWFFMLQGVVVGIEQLGKKFLGRYNLAVPTVVAVGLTVPLQMWLAHMLFFPPCTDADMTGQLLGGLVRNFQTVRELLTP